MRKDLRKYIVLGAGPMVGIAIGAAVFHEWLWHTIQSNVAMNMKIIISMMVGAALMYWRLWQMWREDKALVAFARLVQAKGEKSGNDTDAIMLRKRMRAVLDS